MTCVLASETGGGASLCNGTAAVGGGMAGCLAESSTSISTSSIGFAGFWSGLLRTSPSSGDSPGWRRLGGVLFDSLSLRLSTCNQNFVPLENPFHKTRI